MSVLSGERWRSTGPTTTITWSFAEGNYAALKTTYATYVDFDASLPRTGDSRALVAAAFDAWEAIANIDFVQVADSPNADIRVGDHEIDGQAGKTLAMTQHWWIGAFYSAAQIYFDVDAYGAGFYQTALHEIGHALGLDHSPLSSSIMYFQRGAITSLQPDDIQGAQSIYGARGNPQLDDYAAAVGTTGVVAVGGAIGGAVEFASDVDWFRINLIAGRTYRFDLEGRATGGGTLEDPYLALFDGAGVLQQTYDDSGVGLNARARFTATSTAPFYLSASSYDEQLGSYRLSVTDVTSGVPASPAVLAAAANILRSSTSATAADLAVKAAAGTLTVATAIGEIVKLADATTTVATLSYQFFTGKIPNQAGVDYLVSVGGGNPNPLNSGYYQAFSQENRYINFAVNLGAVGEGRAAFDAGYGNLDLLEATKKAYATIFGSTPTDAKAHALIDTRADYFAAYGGDGPEGLGTKAAMVGWLLGEAAKADLGVYSRSNDAFLTDLADGANFAVDIVGVYGKPEFAYMG